MNLLVLISNNVMHDNRVKRHIKALAPKFSKVLVSYRPIPDERLNLDIANVTGKVFNHTPGELVNKRIRDDYAAAGLLSELVSAFPPILLDKLAVPGWLPFSLDIQGQVLATPRFRDVRNVTTNDEDALSDAWNVLWTLDFFIQWANEARQIPADVVYCNDLETLLCGVVHKKIFNSRLIYDAHELAFDIVPGHHSRVYKNTMALLEYKLTQMVDVLLGVSGAQLDWMREAYGLTIPCLTIPNCSEYTEAGDYAPPLPSTPLRVYYHGASDQWRGLEATVDAIQDVEDVVLMLRCLDSDNLPKLKARVRQNKLDDKVFFLDPVQGSGLSGAVRESADIGIHACDVQPCMNIQVALSNKFIEYLKAGVPVITSPLREQARIVKDYALGFVLKDNSPEEIARAIKEAAADPERLRTMGNNALRAYRELFQWAHYEETLQRTVVGN